MREWNKAGMVPMVWVNWNWWWKDYTAYKISIKEFFPFKITHSHKHTLQPLNLCRCVFCICIYRFMVVTKYKVRNRIAMKIHLMFYLYFSVTFTLYLFCKTENAVHWIFKLECKTGCKHCEVANTNNMFINILYAQQFHVLALCLLLASLFSCYDCYYFSFSMPDMLSGLSLILLCSL